MFVIVQYISLTGLLAGFGLCCAAVFSPYWALNDPEDAKLDNIIIYKGLWIKCQEFSTGNMDCDNYDRFYLGIPFYMKRARALGVASLVLSILAFWNLVVVLDFWPCLKSKPKRIVRCVVGALGITAGVLILVAVSLYAKKLDINNQETAQRVFLVTIRYVYGKSLYFGWVSGAVSIVSGGLAIFSAYKRNKVDNTTAVQQPNNAINEQKV